MASMEGIPTPEFESQHELATFLSIKTVECPKITHMLPLLSSTGTAMQNASRNFHGQHESLYKKRGVT